MANSTVSSSYITRCAFDIGSGSTKMQTCVIDPNSGKILKHLAGRENPLSFGADFIKSGKLKSLSEDIQQEGLSLLREMKAIAESHGATQFHAVATEVFRKAEANGQAFLDRVYSELGIKVTLVTQQLEAELGFSSVVAVSGLDSITDPLVWDSGGASFQITRRSPSGDNVYESYMGSLGTSVTSAILIRDIRGLDFATSVSNRGTLLINPVSEEEARAFSSVIEEQHLKEVPCWLKDADLVLAAAGCNSLFRVCCDVLSCLRASSSSSISSSRRSSHGNNSDKGTKAATEEPASGEDIELVTSFTLADAQEALAAVIGKSDDELSEYTRLVPNSEGPSVVVPKLILLNSVMKKTGIKAIQTVHVYGSCPGLLINEKFWK